MEKAAQKKLLKTGLILTLALIIGRFTGLFREVLIAKEFGATADADITVLLLSFPDMVLFLFVGAAMNVAFLPRFQELAREQASGTFLKLSAFVFFVFSLISLLLFAFPDKVINLLAPGIPYESLGIARPEFRLMLLAPPFAAAAALTRSFLESQSRFLIPALGNSIFNLSVILGVFFLYQKYGLRVVTIAIIAGVFLRWFSQLVRILFSEKFTFKNVKNEPIPRAYYMRYVQALGAGSLLAVMHIMARSLTSSLGEGFLAIYNYAYKMVEFPLGTVLIVFPIILFPKLSQLFTDKNDDPTFIGKAYMWLSAFSCAIVGGLLSLFYVLMKYPVSFGRLSEDNLNQVFLIATLMLLSLPIRALSTINLSFINAKRDTLQPFKINLIAVGSFAFVAPVAFRAFDIYGLMGVFVLTFLVIFILEVLFIRKNYKFSVFRAVINMKTVTKMFIAFLPFILGFGLMQIVNTGLKVGVVLCFVEGFVALGLLKIYHKREHGLA